MIRKSLFLLLLVSFSFVAQAQADLAKIDAYIEKARTDWEVPGLAVGIVKDGKIVHSKGYGLIEEGKAERINENTLFAIASNTKAFIASAIGTLVDQGKLNWKDKVRDYLPYFELYDSYVTAEATIEDLLCHRLGLGTFSGDVIWYKSELSAEEVIRRAKYVPQVYGMRDGYGYSNLMFITAGEVIKSVTGKEWHQYIRETFFQPLAMNRTVTSTNDLEAAGNVATPHKPVDGVNKPIPWTNWDNMGAAGGIISSADDMAKWMIMQLNRGALNGKQLLQSSTQDLLWTPHNNFVVTAEQKATRPGRNFNGYGLGWGVSDKHGRRIISHGGGYDGMYSRVAMMPEENLGIVVLTNGMKGISTALTEYIMERYLEMEEKDWSSMMLANAGSLEVPQVAAIKAARIQGTKPSLPTSDYAGIFYSPMYGDIYVKNENGKMRLEFSHAPLLSATLEHWHYDTWQIIWDRTHAWFDFGTVEFKFDSQRNINGMYIDVPNGDIFFHELNLRKVSSPTISSR